MIDSQCAFEILTRKLEEAAKKTEAAAADQKDEKGSKAETGLLDNPVVKQVGRTAGSAIASSLSGALGLDGRPGRGGSKSLI